MNEPLTAAQEVLNAIVLLKEKQSLWLEQRKKLAVKQIAKAVSLSMQNRMLKNMPKPYLKFMELYALAFRSTRPIF